MLEQERTMRGMTVVNKDLEQAEARTAPGMAFWAGTGPPRSTCGKCASYSYYYEKSSGDTSRRTKSCEKFYKMTGRHGDSLKKNQSACKYFEPATDAQLANR
jgi:hypothetical protein